MKPVIDKLWNQRFYLAKKKTLKVSFRYFSIKLNLKFSKKEGDLLAVVFKTMKKILELVILYKSKIHNTVITMSKICS